MKSRRALRRHHTKRVSARRRSDHVRIRYVDGISDPVCKHSDTYFSKKPGLGCTKCSKRKKGRPRVAGGLCDIGSRDRIYKWRRDKLVLSHLLKSGFDPDSDEVAAVTSPRMRKWE